MAHHHEDHAASTPQEREFADYIRRGDDLFNIDQYTGAREFYEQALELHLNDKLVHEKLDAIKKKQSHEFKTIVKILAVAAVIVAVFFLIK